MFSIPQSTSFVLVFKAYLSSDHVTEATGKTIAITISKAGGAFGNPNAGATNATEISSGWYKVTLDTTDTGTLGIIAIRGAAATIDDFGDRMYVVKATNGGFTALPDTAVTTNASLLTSGTGTAQLSVASGLVTLAASQPGVTIPTVTTVTNQLTAAAIATGVWQDATAGDFTATSSIGKSLYTSGNAPGAASGIALVGSNMGTITGALTAAQIATGVWTDTTAGDFTTALSVGKSVMNGVSLGTGLTINDITTKTGYSLSGTQNFNLTGSITGSLSGSVGSVTGAVGSVTGAVGSVTGAVGSVTGLTASNLDATISSRMATYTQPTGFLSATFPSGTVANTTNISAGTITTTTNLTTNNDKTGYALTSAYDPAKTASQAGDAMALTSGERNSTADALLNRDMSTGSDSGSTTVRTVRQALRFLRNKWAISAGTLTVYKEDDSTSSWTSAVSTDGTAQPIVGTDPAGP